MFEESLQYDECRKFSRIFNRTTGEDSWVDLYNPDAVSCSSTSGCQRKFFSADGRSRLISTGIHSNDFDVEGASDKKVDFLGAQIPLFAYMHGKTFPPVTVH